MSSTPFAAPASAPGHKDGREVEWQLASTDLASVRRWLNDHETIDGLVLEPRTSLKIFDTYFDTDDWRIYRAGFALRIRSALGRKSEATLKSLHSASSEMADRREVSETLESAEADAFVHSHGPVGTRVQAVRGDHRLQPLFEVHTSRQRYFVKDTHNPQPLGEIALDETVISRPDGQPQSSIQRVEVEALTDSHESLQGLVEALRHNCLLSSAAENKYAHGLKCVGLHPLACPEFEPSAVDPAMPIGEIALTNLRRYLSAWHQHEPGARLGDDPEELHDLRVAGRRLDAILQQFREFLPLPLVRGRRTLKRALRTFGDARDLDVALQELDDFAAGLNGREQASLTPLKLHLQQQRDAARTSMLRVLDSDNLAKTLNRLSRAVVQPSTATQAVQVPALSAISALLRTRYRKVRRRAKALSSHSPLEEFHALRAQLKKLRYTLEAVAVLVGKPADEMAASLRRWQDKLGIQQDAAVASRRLKALAATPPPGLTPETLFLMGRLAARYAEVASKAGRKHKRASRKVHARWKTLRSRLDFLLPTEAPLPATGP